MGHHLDLSDHADIAQLAVELERMNTALAADPGQLRSAERSAQIPQKPGVDPDDARVDTGSHAPAAAQIAGPDGRGESVRCIVREREDLFLRVERRDVAT